MKTATMTTILTLLFLAASSKSFADECDGAQCFSIGSFNIKMLGDRGPANTRDEIEELAERISNDAKLDIAVLQEINVGSTIWTERLLPVLEDYGYTLAGYGAFGGSNPERQQHVVLLYRPSMVDFIGEVRDIDTPTDYANGNCEYDSVRPPTVGQFRIRDSVTRVSVVGVHLKSQRPPNGIGDCDDEIRAHQTQTIVGEIAALKSDDMDSMIIAIGDFNGEFAAPEFNAFREIDMDTVVPTDCDKPTREGCTYLLRSYAGVIDHIVLEKSVIGDAWISTTIEGAHDLDDYLQSQSDHSLVWARFLVQSE